MTTGGERRALDGRFYAMLVAAGLATYLLHEGGHWIAGRLMGLELRFSLNGVVPLGGATLRQHVLMSAAGPLVTIVQGVVAFAIVRRRASTTAFAFLLWAAFMRLVAGGISAILPNDEARIGTAIGVGYWTLPIVVAAGLCAMAWAGRRAFRIRPRDWLFLYLVLSATSAAIVFGDRALQG